MKRPYVTLKFAQTLDGKIAAKDGSSKWISGPAARKFAHKLRAEADAILVGSGTALKDNPSLTTRLVKGKNSVRIIIDSRLRISSDSKLVKDAKHLKTIVVTTAKAPSNKIKILKKMGVELIIQKKSKHGGIDLNRIIRILYTRGIKKLLVEGGSEITTSFLRKGFADKLVMIISPKLLGDGIQSIGSLGIQSIKKVLKLNLKSVKRLGDDIVYEACLKK